MSKLSSNKRKVENELFFRQHNERVARGFNNLKQIAKEEGEAQWYKQADEPIPFFCECSDENCKKRVNLRPTEYFALRENKKQFIIFPGHDVPAIERKIKSKPKLQIVEKYKVPNKKVVNLKPSDVNNG